MKPTLQKIILIVAAGLFFFNHHEARAGAAPLEPKSVTTAIILGFDPIPSDALFYAGKPLQGTINLILGGIGAGFFYTGLILDAHADHSDMNNIGNVALIYIGAGLYFPALAWDLLGGVLGVYRHNEEVKNQSARGLSTFKPLLALGPDATFIGGQMRF